MTFKLPDKYENTAAALRSFEPQAPKQLKAVMIQAAEELEHFHRVGGDAIRELDEAAALRIGQMDSQSRADEVSRQVRSTMTSIASRLRALIEVNGGSNGRRT